MCVDFIDSFSITMLSVVSDLLMLEAYFSLSPAAKVDFCFSEPAKSTKCIFADLIEYPSALFFFYRVVMKSVRMECDRDDYRFIFVSAVVLFFIPFLIFSMISISSSTLIYNKFSK
jgi:hypothetical protein